MTPIAQPLGELGRKLRVNYEPLAYSAAMMTGWPSWVTA
jgi:hypothetical protein